MVASKIYFIFIFIFDSLLFALKLRKSGYKNKFFGRIIFLHKLSKRFDVLSS